MVDQFEAQNCLHATSSTDNLVLTIISKYSSKPTTILAVIVWGPRPNTVTSNLSEVEMNICIIVYLLMSFVGHIEVKESPSKILKLIQCIFICIFYVTEWSLYITQDQEAFQDCLCRTISENNLLTQPFEKSAKNLSISRQLNTLEDTGKLRNWQWQLLTWIR